MTRRFWFFLGMVFLAALLVAACGDDDDDDDDATDDDDDDADDDDSGPELLYAAAGQAVITPTAQNHPETIYLGGVFPSRLATGVHDDLLAAALVLKKGDEHVVLVSLDFLGFSLSRIREIRERLARIGLDPEKILIASTHTHEAPDTLGVFGPNVLTSGVSPTYMAFVQDTIVALVADVWHRVVPVTMRAATAEVNDPLSNYPTLISDSRQPEITVDWLSAARFDDLQGRPVATLVNWHSHPEVMIASTKISADFVRWTRLRMESEVGGTCVYISGAVGGLGSPYGVDVPARDEQGEPVQDGQGNPVYLQDGTWEKTRSLGFVIADLAIEALEGVAVIEQPALSVVVEPMLLPIRNPIMILAIATGLVEADMNDLVADQPETCGFFGCTSERIGLVRLGPLALTTAPGETFPETLIGRACSQFDFGGEWGAFTFEAIDGLLGAMDADVPMHMGLCGNEVGYLIPESDFHGRDHPDYYEEDLNWGRDAETVYRRAMFDLLRRY